MALVEGQLILCTVKKIEKTNIFLDIEDEGEGSMVLSEVAAGRIRNLREYVIPNKKIVCKVLNVSQGHVELSLRRVTAKEKYEVLERHKKERSLISMLKNIVTNPEELVKKIKKEYDFVTFLEDAKDNPNILEKFFSKSQIEKILNILKEKIEKEKEVRKIFKLSSVSPNAITEMKEILDVPDSEINYLGSSRFSISAKAKDFKEANKNLLNILHNIEKKAKEKKAIFELIEK
ncbi:MAG: hypothetical protein Q7S27_04705 [Nanoarchaeota archaeon]|nr:hypothetical protein [Nanoarchaeota archaeon]